jgi:hydroxymethylbilane synthase
MSAIKIKVGSRPSLLATVQARQCLDAIDQKAKALGLPAVEWEMIAIKTSGDIQVDRPLWQMEGQNFFTRELDVALLDQQVDVVIHSFKDLGAIRPDEFYFPAITERSMPYDVMIMNESLLGGHPEKSIKKDTLTIGTSSPRRNVLLAEYLPRYLPQSLRSLKIEFAMLRGNVPTRLEKLKQGNYDAIILAAAGMERLCQNESAREILSSLLKNTNIKFLPLAHFPPAAGQGALAIESLTAHPKRKIIDQYFGLINCEATKAETLEEKRILKLHGGGCHLPLGILVKQLSQNESLCIVQGIVNETKVASKELTHSDKKFRDLVPSSSNANQAFVGMASGKPPFVYDRYFKKVGVTNKNPNLDNFDIPLWILTSRYALDTFKTYAKGGLNWAAGQKSHEVLADHDLWCHGDFAGLGDTYLENIINSSLLKTWLQKSISSKTTPIYFTKADSQRANTVAAYQHVETPYTDIALEDWNKLKNCRLFFWTSFDQYEYYRNLFRHHGELMAFDGSIHACGPGQTYEQFIKNETSVFKLSGPEELTKLFKTNE